MYIPAYWVLALGISLTQYNPVLGNSLLLSQSLDNGLRAPCANLVGEYPARTSVTIFSRDIECASTDTFAAEVVVNVPPAVSEGKMLLWINKISAAGALLDEEPSFDDSLNTFLSRFYPAKDTQRVLLPGQSAHVLWSSSELEAAIVAVAGSDIATVDYKLPRLLKLSLIPSTNLAAGSVDDSHIKAVLSSLKFNPDVASCLSSLSLPQMINDVRWLTGEASSLVSRHSFSDGARLASKWLQERFEETGAQCFLEPFLYGFAPNVKCRYAAVDSNATVILGAHYDSRGSFGSLRAPGGDDDGSGVGQLLAIARTIKRKGIKFRTNVELVAFAGEEQGLLGSNAYATQLRSQSANILLMIQSDMIAYHSIDEPMQLGLPDKIGNPTASQLLANVSAIYSPELQVGVTSACCSDHQSFHQAGFPATQAFERAGPIIDPYYHNSKDLSARPNYDFNQSLSITKVTFATLLHTAGFYLEI